MTRTARNQTQTRTRATWGLGEREPYATRYGASGQIDYWAVRVEWSEKLGLQLECRNEAQAVRMAGLILRTGAINPDRWKRYFLSQHQDRKRWETFYAD